MTPDQDHSVRRALHNATYALDHKMPWMAEAWAKTASEVIREAQLSARQQRALVAPHDGPTRGDKAVIGCVILVFVWLLADTIGALL